MPRDLGQWLHDTAVEPSGPVDPRSLIARGRRRRRIRHGMAATGSVAAVVLVGLLVVGALTGSPDVVLESGPGVQRPRPDVEAGAPFVPPSAVDGDLRVLELRFPDGVTAEIAYPADVDVHERGATPGGVLSIADDQDETARRYGRARTRRSMEAHRGDLDDVLRRLNDGDTPEVLAEYDGPGGDPVPLVSLAVGDYLVWQAGRWALLLPDAVGDGPALSDADRALYAAHLHPGEDTDGWLAVRADPPLRTEQAYVFLGDPDAAVQHARDPAPQPQAEGRADRLLVHPSACTWTERFEEPGMASWCDLDTQLSFDVAGARTLSYGSSPKGCRRAPPTIQLTSSTRTGSPTRRNRLGRKSTARAPGSWATSTPPTSTSSTTSASGRCLSRAGSGSPTTTSAWTVSVSWDRRWRR